MLNAWVLIWFTWPVIESIAEVACCVAKSGMRTAARMTTTTAAIMMAGRQEALLAGVRGVLSTGNENTSSAGGWAGRSS